MQLARAIVVSFIMIISVSALAQSRYLARYSRQVTHLPDMTKEERLKDARERFEANLLPLLQEKGVSEKPKAITFVFFKDQRKALLYVGDDERQLKLIKSYDVTAASGKPGPKLKEGDRQVPEGIYGIDFLNPNSKYHLSMRVTYPNQKDLKQAREEGRSDLGGDIMIHGDRRSIGCIALGDEAIAEIYHLASVTKLSQWKLLLSPTDLRTNAAPTEVVTQLPWMANIYDDLARELQLLPPIENGTESEL